MEPRSPRTDLAEIAKAGLAAVDPEQLVRHRLEVANGRLLVDERPLEPGCDIGCASRVVVVGGGKAAAAMAAGVAGVLAAGGVESRRVSGLVSVPEGSERSIPGIEVRATRPAGINLPTQRAEAATRTMLALIATLGPADVVIAVISGGGSAVLAAARRGVPLTEKVAVAGFLAAAGADIRELNTVRRAASDVKGGGLARACSAGRLVVLVLSDVIGDPLEFIASGPCLPGDDAATALDILERYGAITAGVAPRLVGLLEQDLRQVRPAPVDISATGGWTTPTGCLVDHILLGSNATVVEAAARAARDLGYLVTVAHAVPGAVETADEVGVRLAQAGLRLAGEAAADGLPRCLVEGGEAVVRLPDGFGIGGRNQQTAAATLLSVHRDHRAWPRSLAVGSIGTDGEDGPTSAAGGLIDATVAASIERKGLDLAQAVARCDTNPLLAAAGGLIETGPTGTNVADLRIAVATTPAMAMSTRPPGSGTAATLPDPTPAGGE